MFDQYSFDNVRRSVSIESFFEHDLQAKQTLPGRYSVCPNPSCGDAGGFSVRVSVRNGFFKCFRCMAKGDVIEAACLLYGINKNQATKQLIDGCYDRPTIPISKSSVKPKDLSLYKRVIETLAKSQEILAPEVIAYLKGRGLSQNTINKGFDSGLIRSLPSANPTENFAYLKGVIGKEDLAAAGMLKGERQFAPASYRQLVFIAKDYGAAEFRLLRAPTERESKVLRYGGKSPFWYPQNPDALLVVEGAIDLLSAIEIHASSSILGLPGANSWEIEWFKPWFGKKITLALDSDEAGQEHARLIKAQLEKEGCLIQSYTPKGKDLNEDIVNSRGTF